MTAHELFKKYATGLVRFKNWPGQFRVCGYGFKEGFGDVIVIEASNGFDAKSFLTSSNKYELIPDLPATWKGSAHEIDKFVWDDVVMPNTQMLCCRCGCYYSSRKKHRPICGKQVLNDQV